MLPLLAIGKEEKVLVRAEDYMHKLVEQGNIYFIATGKIKETRQIITAMKVLTMHNPKLIVKVRLCTPLLLYLSFTLDPGYHKLALMRELKEKYFVFIKRKLNTFFFYCLHACHVTTDLHYRTLNVIVLFNIKILT